MRHIMLDLETLGSTPGSVILSIGAVEFTDKVLKNQFYRGITISSSLRAGLTINPDTYEWWGSQHPEAQREAFFPESPYGLDESLFSFAGYIDSDTCVWARGPDFDCVLLAAAYQKVNIRRPWKFHNTRDVRTILALGNIEPSINPHKHNALADATCQAQDVIRALDVIGEELK